MNRSVLLLTCGVVLAAAAAYLLLATGEPADPYEVGPDGGPGLTLPEDPAASLQGTGTGNDATLAIEPASVGEQRIAGIVLDPEGKAAAGVEVVARFTNPQWDDPDAFNEYHGAVGQRRRAARRFNDPAAEAEAVSGRATTDTGGRFIIEGLGYGTFQLRARVEPPLLSLGASATISRTWQTGDTTLRLLRGVPLAGKVVDAADRPVAAVIRATWNQSKAGVYRSWRSDPIHSQEEDGAFALPAAPAGTLSFAVTVPGKLRVTNLEATAPSETPIVLRLPGGGGVVGGKVTDQTETAVRGALVIFTLEGAEGSGRSTVQAVTDASGTYAFRDIPTGTLANVQVLAPGFAPLTEASSVAAWDPFTVTAEAQTLDFRLLRGGTVKGRVVASGSGEGLAGARVHVFVARAALGHSARAPLSGIADETGAFRIEGVPGGRLVVLASHDTHYLKALYAGSPNPVQNYDPNRVVTSPPALTRLMPRNGATLEIDIALEPGLAIEGSVIGPDGAPVADAEVRVKNLNPSQRMQHWGVSAWSGIDEGVRSDAQGHFTLAALPPGRSYELFAKKDGFAARYSKPIPLESEQPAPHVTLTLVQGATVRGRVLGADDKGLSGANVHIWGQNQVLAGGRTNATTDAEGRFEVTGLAAGDYQFWIQQAGFGSGTSQGHIKNLEEGEVREDIEVRFEGGYVVSGTLTDSKAIPVKHQSIQLMVENQWYHTNTDASGAFSFANVKRGTAKLYANVNGGPNKQLGEPFEVPAEGIERTYDKPESHTIEGTILDAAGDPVPLCVLKITGKGNRGQNIYAPGASSQFEVVYGAFRRAVAGPPPYRLEITAARGVDGTSLNLAPHSRSLTELPDKPLEIRLKAGKELTGTVTDAVGNPVPDVTVRAGHATAISDARGRFRLGGLGGRTSMQFEVPRGYVKPPNRTAAAGDEVDVVLLAGLSIRGRAFDPEGKPLPSGWINANWSKTGGVPAGTVNGQIRSGGVFELEGIPDGVLVSVKVNGPWFDGKQRYAPKTVGDVRPGTTDLEVYLGASVEIRGHVLDSDGNPWKGGWIYAKGPDGQWVGGMQQIKADGGFALGGLSAGEVYEIGVQQMNGGGTGVTKTVTAPAVGVVLRMAKAAAISGRLVGEDTKGFRIHARRVSGEGNTVYGSVKEDGTFEVPSLSIEEEWVLTALKRGDDRYAQSERVAAGTAGVTLRLQKGGSISGRVTLGGSVPGQKLWIQCSRAGLSTWTQTLEDGTYEAKGLPPGRYELRAMHPAQRTRSEPVQAETGATGVDMDL